MDDLIEFLVEFFLDVLSELAQNKKISKWIRYPILFIMSGIYITIVVLFLILTYQQYQEKQYIVSLFFLLLIALLVGILIGFIKKIVKEEKKTNINSVIHK